MTLSPTIAVLVHERQRKRQLPHYLIYHLANHWRDDGYRVHFIHGTGRFVPADLVIVHVDLSLVPGEYVDFAARYPRSINARAIDIRKSTTNPGLLRRGDAWDGPVIVKTDLNHGGLPELRLRRWGWFGRGYHLVARELGGAVGLHSWRDYRVFDHLAAVPDQVWLDRRLVVERFLPERELGLYWVRVCQFLGPRVRCRRIGGYEPISRSGDTVEEHEVTPHAAIEEWRGRLGLEFGKIDYVVHEGRAVLLDANKTTGVASTTSNPARAARRRALADGLRHFVGPPRPA